MIKNTIKNEEREKLVMDMIIIGCGFAGSVIARKILDYNPNIKIRMIEKRNHIAGNMYDEIDESGVLVHKYGPHIFHTNSKEVFEFVGKYTEYIDYKHEVVGNIDGINVPIPFNFTGIDKLFSINKSTEIKRHLRESYRDNERVSIKDLLASEDKLIKSLGEYIYEKVFVHYTAKQWGMPIEKIDTSVINRIPVVMGYESKHFTSKYQYMPKDGFTKIFEKMLDSPNIEIIKEVNAKDILKIDDKTKKVTIYGKEFTGPIVMTGALDELLDYRFGVLPYRSLDLVFEKYNMNYYQQKPVVNYPNTENFTRITEFKYLTGQILENHTTILKEYPLTYDPKSEKGNIPYYPVINEESYLKYKQYYNYFKQISKFYLCGRLAEYKYYDMNSVILQAFKVADMIIKENF